MESLEFDRWIGKRLETALSNNLLSPSSLPHLRLWLTDVRYAGSVQIIANLIAQERWRDLDDAFWTVIPFGTAGRRGRMFPVGPNAINDRTMGESAAGLAAYLVELYPAELTAATLQVAIGYDTRHRSRQFAELCAEILTAAGIRVAFLNGHRATPELAFTVRALQCQAGIMISASHNPPSDNAIKVFWSGGAQIRPPHDAALIARVEQVQIIARLPFTQELAAGRIRYVEAEMDTAYQEAVLKVGGRSKGAWGQGSRGGGKGNEESKNIGPAASTVSIPVHRLSSLAPRNSPAPLLPSSPAPLLRLLFSPLHGVGRTSVEPVLRAAGFEQLEVYAPQAEPDGDFPNVPGHVANPENAVVFDALIAAARTGNFDLVLASDPDADRIGAACRVNADSDDKWVYLTGNQLGVLLGEWRLRTLQARGELTPQHFIVKTLVTGDMLVRQAECYGIAAVTDVLTGFKWIGKEIDDHGPEWFVFGFEEAHGYLAGTHIRDKDAAVAALLLAQFAAELKSQGSTLYQELLRLYQRVGCHQERAFALTLPGADGMTRMKRVMQTLRDVPPASLASIAVTRLRDYERQTVTPLFPNKVSDGKLAPLLSAPLIGPRTEMIFLDLAAPGHSVAIRPSGTEPKLKFYLFSMLPPEESQDVSAAQALLQNRLGGIEAALRAYVGVE